MSNPHTLSVIDEDLDALRNEVVRLATQVNEELDRAVRALVERDARVARAVIESDPEADALQNALTGHMQRALARQQAVAGDLRMILAAGRIGVHLERIGDYAKNAAKRALRLKQPLNVDQKAHFAWMGTRIKAMLDRVIESYLRDDAQSANVAWTDDVELDTLYSKLFASLLGMMNNHPERIADGIQLLFIAKGLERAGDHITDIAEEVYLMITGHPLQGARPKVDESSALEADDSGH